MQHANNIEETSATSGLKGDLLGGISSAIITLPNNVALGMLALGLLGPDYIGIAVLAGMTASIYVSLTTCLFSNTQILISGPGASTALIIAGVLSKLLASSGFNITDPNSSQVLLVIIFFIVLLSGIFQVLFAALKLGNIVKFISTPVVVGIINGTALLIFIDQLGPLLGVGRSDVLNLFNKIPEIKWPSFSVTSVTLVLILAGSKIFKKVPAPIIGILGGSALYYLFLSVGIQQNIGDTLGPIRTGIPDFKLLSDFINIFQFQMALSHLPLIISAALTIALINSVYSLLVIVFMRSKTENRPNYNLELIGQGFGNMLSASIGGLPANTKIADSLANYNSGGRTKLSVFISCLTVFIIFFFLNNLISGIPRPVMTGVLISIGVMIFDRLMLRQIKDVVNKKTANFDENLVNLIISISVMLVTIFYNFMSAMAVGIIISVFIFIGQTSRSVVRNIYFGSHFNSKKQRSESIMEFLNANKNKIAIVELDGALFFGSADRLEVKLETLEEQGVRYIVLDMKRLTKMDSTGAKIVVQTHKQLAKKGCRLLISYLTVEDNKWHVMKDINGFDSFIQDSIFPDTSLAVELCEDELLAGNKDFNDIRKEPIIQDLLRQKGMADSEIHKILPYLEKEEYTANQYIMRQGEDGDSLFILEKGEADINIKIKSTGRRKRLRTLLPGSIIGEMALIDGELRSADIISNKKTVCFKLTSENFIKLKAENPELAISFYAIITRTLTNRLRVASETIVELEI